MVVGCVNGPIHVPPKFQESQVSSSNVQKLNTSLLSDLDPNKTGNGELFSESVCHNYDYYLKLSHETPNCEAAPFIMNFGNMF